ncbi:hypothetical protein CCMA1212_007028 [Trichoderma ghanense]|uniref:Uncharacterized protein n=1 Tax=Trichoderma ghanense TaxID=65468 RepID=A0ABY2H2V0_9HYPO
MLAGLITYIHRKRVDGTYAFALFLVGTLLLCCGTGTNSYVLGSSTEEEYFQPAKNLGARMVWLQQKQTLADQEFEPTALFTGEGRPNIVTSSRIIITQDPDFKDIQRRLAIWTYIGLALTLVGFITQQVGVLRLHWSVRIASLGVAFFVVGVRAWARRGRTKPIFSRDLPPGFELDWLTDTIRDLDSAPWMRGRNEPASGPSNASSTQPDGFSDSFPNLPGAAEAQECTKLRHDLAKLANWRSPVSQEATQRAETMGAAMDQLHTECGCKDFIFADKGQTGRSKDPEARFTMSRQPDGKWMADAEEVEAALSLKVFSATFGGRKQTTSGCVGFGDEPTLDQYMPIERIRILGRCSDVLLRHLSWWAPTDGTPIRVGQEEYVTAEEGDQAVGPRTERNQAL